MDPITIALGLPGAIRDTLDLIEKTRGTHKDSGTQSEAGPAPGSDLAPSPGSDLPKIPSSEEIHNHFVQQRFELELGKPRRPYSYSTDLWGRIVEHEVSGKEDQKKLLEPVRELRREEPELALDDYKRVIEAYIDKEDEKGAIAVAKEANKLLSQVRKDHGLR